MQGMKETLHTIEEKAAYAQALQQLQSLRQEIANLGNTADPAQSSGFA